jgi:hypothetical protein
MKEPKVDDIEAMLEETILQEEFRLYELSGY